MNIATFLSPFRYPVTVTSGPAASAVTAVASAQIQADEDDYDKTPNSIANLVPPQAPPAEGAPLDLQYHHHHHPHHQDALSQAASLVHEPEPPEAPQQQEPQRVALPSFNRILFTQQGAGLEGDESGGTGVKMEEAPPPHSAASAAAGDVVSAAGQEEDENKNSILLHPGEENDHSLNATAPPGNVFHP